MRLCDKVRAIRDVILLSSRLFNTQLCPANIKWEVSGRPRKLVKFQPALASAQVDFYLTLCLAVWDTITLVVYLGPLVVDVSENKLISFIYWLKIARVSCWFDQRVTDEGHHYEVLTYFWDILPGNCYNANNVKHLLLNPCFRWNKFKNRSGVLWESFQAPFFDIQCFEFSN